MTPSDRPLPRSSVAATVRPFVKPCSQLDIYTNWKPDPVKVVFLAEAPPGKSEGYFYDHRSHLGYAETLRKALFDFLELDSPNTKGNLVQFKRRGYLLLDAVKCRCKKKGGQPPTGVRRTCATRWLGRELHEIPGAARIVVLGRTALLGLSEVEEFEQLARCSVIDNCGEVREIADRTVLIWPFPNWRNEDTFRPHLTTFKKFCFVADARRDG